jgi:hypothetical protein
LSTSSSVDPSEINRLVDALICSKVEQSEGDVLSLLLVRGASTLVVVGLDRVDQEVDTVKGGRRLCDVIVAGSDTRYSRPKP